MITIQLLIILMIVAALIAVEVKDMISSVIAIGAVGLALSLCFLLLKAPDLAIVLLIIEVLTLTIMVGYTVSRSGIVARKWSLINRVTAGGIAAVFVVICFMAMKGLPPFGRPLTGAATDYALLAIPKSGTPNAVAAVALDFRGFDSLAGIAVLLLVALGVSSIMGKKERKAK
jgi:multisubunit Na+/H+ antiporter MnhB subunit